jgi:protein-S-isoprenylcysteine O-methyltransferase Ste14
MSYRHEPIKTGIWLFRWRSYLPFILVVVVLPAFHDFSYPFGSQIYQLIWELLCLSISLFGLSIRAYTIGYTPKGTSGRNTKRQLAETLNTTGMYSVTRNPLYFGNFFTMLGVILFVRSWWLCLISVLTFWLYYKRIIMAEENFLKNKFGKKYEAYPNRTPSFFPNIKKWRKSYLTFSFKNVLQREYSGFFGVIVAFTILAFIGDYIVENKIISDPVWAGIFVSGLILYITMRTIKKKTGLLHDEGR